MGILNSLLADRQECQFSVIAHRGGATVFPVWRGVGKSVEMAPSPCLNIEFIKAIENATGLECLPKEDTLLDGDRFGPDAVAR